MTQEKYERSGKDVDAELRRAFPKPRFGEFQEDQERVVARCQGLEASSNTDEAEESPWVKLDSQSLTGLWMRHTPAKVGERSIATGKAMCVLDTSAFSAATTYFMALSRLNMRLSASLGHPARLLVSQVSAHDFTWATIKKAPFPFRTSNTTREPHPPQTLTSPFRSLRSHTDDRELVARQVFLKDAAGSFVVAFEPPMEAIVVDYGKNMRAVRGRATGYIKFTPAGNAQCKLELYQRVDLGGRIPAWVVNRDFKQALVPAMNLRDLFQRDDEIDASDRGALATTIR